MNWLPHTLSMSSRAMSTAGRPRTRKPSLESLEQRALLSASPSTLYSHAYPSAAASPRSPVIVSVARLSHAALPHLISLDAAHGRHTPLVMIHSDFRHAVAK